jgi:hypothetical protein
MRNLANDLIKAQGCTIRVSELGDYARFCKLEQSDKKALHEALVTHMGAIVETRRYWRAGAQFSEKAYCNIYWNLDHGFPDFLDFFNFSSTAREYTPPVINTGAPQ